MYPQDLDNLVIDVRIDKELCGEFPHKGMIEWAGVASGFAVVCIMLGFTTNIMTIYTIWARKSIRSQSVVHLILYLSASDLALSLFVVPVQASRYSNLNSCNPGESCDMPWPLGKFTNFNCQQTKSLVYKLIPIWL